MKNFILVSPNYPHFFYKYATALKKKGFNVLGIGDTPYDQLLPELKDALTEYYFLANMNVYQEMFKAVAYFSFKYGHIDELESNNEFWLKYDAMLRKDFNINGIKSDDIEDYKRKDKMKYYYDLAEVPNARYTIVKDFEQCKAFINLVSYPVFVKPVEGVGATSSYKISNDEELNNFLKTKDDEEYIMEEFIDGKIVSFDALVDKDSDVVIYASHEFPYSNADLVNDKLDGYYYCTSNIDHQLIEKGIKIIKAFKVKKRFVHLEFFRLNEAKEGLGQKNDVVALEVNMRCGGGHVPELFSLTKDVNIYDIYASIMNDEKLESIENTSTFYTIEVTRRKEKHYQYSDEDIIKKYQQNFIEKGTYDPLIAMGMGGEYYYIARFNNLEDLNEFKDYVLLKVID